MDNFIATRVKEIQKYFLDKYNVDIHITLGTYFIPQSKAFDIIGELSPLVPKEDIKFEVMDNTIWVRGVGTTYSFVTVIDQEKKTRKDEN